MHRTMSLKKPWYILNGMLDALLSWCGSFGEEKN
jgi:hypothetical protein